MPDRPPQKTLLSESIRLLRDRPNSLSLESIAHSIGVSSGWLSNLLGSRDSSGVRVDCVQRLYDLLSDEPLFPPDKTDVIPSLEMSPEQPASH